MTIENITISQAREIAALFGCTSQAPAPQALAPQTLNTMLGQKVIVRTYSAGVWFGTLSDKSGVEVILTSARRMWFWKAKESISLSACALYGIELSESKIVAPVPSVWLEAIEIMPCSESAILSIEGAPHVEAE